MMASPERTESTSEPSNLNIANVLTMLRILGVPVFGWLLLSNEGTDPQWRVWAWVLFVVLMFTDRIDGDIARSRGLVTDFGKLADPIADKALTGMAFIGLAIIFDNWIFWTITIVVLVREWGITTMRFFIKKYGVMPASQGGRLKTLLQALALGLYVLPFDVWENTASDIMFWVAHILMAAAVLVTVVTAVQYVLDARRIRAEYLHSA